MSQINNLFVQRNGIGSQYLLSSYDPAQDVTPNGFAITQNQTQLELKGNTWKKVDFLNNYTITANTILEFDFQSTIEGEVHGIGLDNDNSVSLNWLFRLSGTQALGLGNFDNYVTGSGWKTYKIPVGNFFTGNFRYLIFSNDHDVTSPTGNGQFRNLRIYENNGVTAVNILPINPVQGEGNTGTSPFTFTVTRSGNTTGTSTVNWSVTGMGDNPATGADFGGTLPSGTVTFTAGQTTKQITVSVSGDISYEADEAFRVTLSNPVGAIINTNTAEGTILNDDAPPPTLDIAPLNAVQGEGDTGTTPFTFTVTRSGDTTGTSTVNWAVTLSGGADAADFGGTLPSGTVTFTPGETTKEIIVDVSGDISHEADEGFSVTLSDAEDAIINTDTAEGIILNDDVPATLDIAPLNAVQGEGDTGTTPFTFTVTRSGDTTGTSTVNWAVTLSGGADAADFSLTPATNNSQRETTTPSRSYAPNRLIVKFKPQVNSTQVDEIKNSLGVVKTQNIRLTGAEIWQLPETTSVETALATYGRSRVFEYIEPDYIVTTAATIPNDPSFNLLWGLHNT
ncbi:Calx-beta domain-containing protein, partial [Umezakia ovalisporum]|uniref:Calx-beta domain-containing protein n=1 Tax=Umezakia ovalisporum TaxID=75695 RepID=UPI0024762FC0